MGLLVEPYQISVWVDVWDSTTRQFVEKRKSIIGSNEMISQNRALSPTLTQNTNGKKTFQFQMYKKYVDQISGEIIENPFSQYLVNERKIKLNYKEKEYDFIIKSIQEDSKNYLFTYTMEETLVQELSKNGFNTTLNSAKKNNTGTALELAQKVLSETNWQVESEIFTSVVEESLVYVKLNIKDHQVYRIKDDQNFYTNGISTELVSFASEEQINVLAFYSSCKNKPYRFQFIKLDSYTDGVLVDENRNILNKNCQYYVDLFPEEYSVKVDNYDLILPSGSNIYTPANDKTISLNFRGKRYGYTQKTLYLPSLDRQVSLYQNAIGTDTNVYAGYKVTKDITPNILENLLDNGDMASDSGWELSKIYNPIVESGLEPAPASEESGTGMDESATVYYNDNANSALFFQDVHGTKLNEPIPPFSKKMPEDFTFLSWDPNINEGDVIKNSLTQYYAIWEEQLSYLTGRFYSDTFRSAFSDLKKNTYDYNNTQAYKSYLRTLIKSDSILVNSGIYNRRASLNNIPANSELVLNIQLYNHYGQLISLGNNFPFEIRLEGMTKTESGYTTQKKVIEEVEQAMFLATPKKDESGNILTYTKTFVQNEVEQTKQYIVLKVDTNNFSTEEQFKTESEIRLVLIPKWGNSLNKYRLYYFRSCELFEKINKSSDLAEDFLIPEDDVFDAWESVEYKYFKFDTKETYEEGSVEFVPEGDNYRFVPQYNSKAEKILSLDFKESNYFNILQSIAEQFSCWLDIYKQKYADGEIVKKVKFKNYIGQDNLAAIRYGVNLKDIARTYQSKDLVTKLVVKSNANKNAESETCSIQRSNLNPTGENYLYNFSYYQNQDIINVQHHQSLMEDLDLGYGPDMIYTKLAEYGEDDASYGFQGYGIEYNNPNEAGDSWETTRGENTTEFRIKRIGSTEVLGPYDITNFESTFNIYGYNQRLRKLNWGILNLSKILNIYKKQLTDKQAEKKIVDTNLSAATSEIIKAKEKINKLTGLSFGSQNILKTAKCELKGEVDYSSVGAFSGTLPADCKLTITEKKSTESNYGEPGKNEQFLYSIDLTLTTKEGHRENTLITLIARPRITVNSYLPIYNENGEVRYYKFVESRKVDRNHTCQFTFKKQGENYIANVTIQISNLYFGGISGLDSYLQSYNEAKGQYDSNLNKQGQLASDIEELEEICNQYTNDIEKLNRYKSILNKEFYNQYCNFIQEGTWIDEKYSDDDLYFIDSQSVLYNSCFPKVEYTINVVAVSQLPGYEDFKFDVGDKTWIEDEDFFGTDEKGYPVREKIVITEIKEFLDAPDKNVIKVRNFKNEFQDLFQKITATTQQLQYNNGSYELGAAEAKYISQEKDTFIRNTLDSLSNLNLSNPDLESKNSSDSGQLIIIDGRLLFRKKIGDSWVTKVGLSENGIAADSITSGILDTGTLRIMNGDKPGFVWNSAGITAYRFIIGDDGQVNENQYDTSSFIRFDHNGLYGMDTLAVQQSTISPDNIENHIVTPLEAETYSTFGLTWEGLKVQGENAELRIGKNTNDLFNGAAYLIKATNKTSNSTIFGITETGEMYLASDITLGPGAKIGSWEVGEGKLAGSWEGNETGIGTLSVDNKIYAIWSGSNTETTTYSLRRTPPEITFGVTTEGEMFSTKGLIGGWEISNNTLKNITSNKNIWSGLYSGLNTTVNSSGWKFTFGDFVDSDTLQNIPATCTLLKAEPIDTGDASSIVIFPERIKHEGSWYTVTKIGGNLWDNTNSIFYYKTENTEGHYGPIVLKYQIPGSVKTVSLYSLYQPTTNQEIQISYYPYNTESQFLAYNNQDFNNQDIAIKLYTHNYTGMKKELDIDDSSPIELVIGKPDFGQNLTGNIRFFSGGSKNPESITSVAESHFLVLDDGTTHMMKGTIGNWQIFDGDEPLEQDYLYYPKNYSLINRWTEVDGRTTFIKLSRDISIKEETYGMPYLTEITSSGFKIMDGGDRLQNNNISSAIRITKSFIRFYTCEYEANSKKYVVAGREYGPEGIKEYSKEYDKFPINWETNFGDTNSGWSSVS